MTKCTARFYGVVTHWMPLPKPPPMSMNDVRPGTSLLGLNYENIL